VNDLRIGSLLHDIGKIGIPDSILLKKVPLTDEEMSLMREHPRTGVNILGQVKLLEPMCPAILEHHERWTQFQIAVSSSRAFDSVRLRFGSNQVGCRRESSIDTRRSAQFRIDFTAARSYLEGVSPPEPGLDGITALNLLSKAAAIKDCFPFLECPVIAIFSLSTMGRV
jgi:hypothetical protein